MASELRALGKHSFIYGVGIIIGKLASFLMLPIYTRYLTPADYGVLELLSMTTDVVGMIAGIGLLTGLYKFYSEAPGADEKAETISTAAIAVVALAALAATAGIVSAPILSRWVIGEHGLPIYVRLFFLIYFFQNFAYVPLALIRAQNRSVLFVTINVVRLVSMLSLNVFTVVYAKMGIVGVMYSTLLTDGVLAVALTGFLLRQVGIRFSRDRVMAMVRFGSPMILWSLGTFVIVFSDRLFLNYFVGTSEVGIYSVAYKFAFVLSALAFAPFQTVWEPRRFELAKRADSQELFSRVFVYMNVVIGLAAAGIALFVSNFLALMSDQQFLPAGDLVPVLVAAQIFFSWVRFCDFGLILSGATKLMGLISVVTAAATVTLNLLLIPVFGMWGAAIATVLAYLLRFVWIYRRSQGAFFIPYDWAAVSRLYSILGAAVVLSLILSPGNVLASLGWNACLFIIAAGLAYIYVLTRWERTVIRDIVARSLIFRRFKLGAS